MPGSFSPSFTDIQRDIERYLKSEGRCERNEHGQEVYRGYDEALARMFRLYLNEGAFGPLVAHFRRWNTEWAYNDFLLTLAAALEKAHEWPLLRELWTAVIARRRKNYNDVRKYRRVAPETIPESSLQKTRQLLLQALSDLEACAARLGRQSDIADVIAMMERVEKGGRA